MEETSGGGNKRRSYTTLTSPPPPHSFQDPPPLPTLPFHIIEEIFCRLPVNLLLQLRCLCKPLNSLISDPKFAKKHLHLSTTHRIHEISYSTFFHNYILTSCPLNCIFTYYDLDDDDEDVTQFEYPSTYFNESYIVGSCNGILCIADFSNSYVLLWNPSIRKCKELPPFEKPPVASDLDMFTTFGFGYDSLTDNYKVVVVVRYIIFYSNFNNVCKTEVKVHTLGTGFWKTIEECPFGVVSTIHSGKFVSGTVNWLATIDFERKCPWFIVSFDLGKETYRKVLPPDFGGVDVCDLKLSVLRDCLCVILGHDIWVMNEYGIQESWTKLFTVSNMSGYTLTKAIDIFEGDQVLLERIGNQKWVVYNSRKSTFKSTRFHSLEVSVESLISPCF